MKAINQIQKILQEENGIVRSKNLSSWHYHQLLEMVKSGEVLRIGRGIYATHDAMANVMYDVATLVPGGIVCAYTAWAHYNLTTQIPTSLCVAVKRGRKISLPDYPPITLYHQSESQLSIGHERQCIQGIEVDIFDIERCVCDAVKYRNKIGIDVCMEILRNYTQEKRMNLVKLHKYAQTLRVDKILSTYLQPLL